MAELSLQEIRKWDSDTIQKKVEQLRVDLFNLRMGSTTSGIERPHLLKVLKKDIARLLTVKNEKGK